MKLCGGYDGILSLFLSLSFKWAWARIEHTGEKPYHCEVEGCGRSFRISEDKVEEVGITGLKAPISSGQARISKIDGWSDGGSCIYEALME